MKKVKEGCKMTEFGQIPDDWRIETLGNIGEFKNGLNKGKEDFGFGYKFVNIQDAYTGNEINTEKLERINANEKEVEIYSLNKGDIVLVRSSVKPEGVGYPILYNGDVEQILYCGFMIRYRYDINKYNPKYMLYQLKSNSVRKKVLDLSTVSANTNINQDSLKQIKILVPEIREQQKISLILSSVDEQIEITNNLIEKTKQLKKGLIQKLLTKGIGHSRFKDTEIGKIPEEWGIENLGNVTEIVRGASPRPKGDPKYYGGNVPRLMISDVTRDGKYVTPRTDFLTEEGAKKSRPMNKGDLIISISGTVALPTFLAVDSCIHDGFIGFKKIDEKLNKDFLYYQILFLREKLIRSATDGGVYINLTTDIVKEFKITIPKLEEQNQIYLILSSVDEQIEQYESKKEKLQEIKKGLMQKLLTGSVRVKV